MCATVRTPPSPPTHACVPGQGPAIDASNPLVVCSSCLDRHTSDTVLPGRLSPFAQSLYPTLPLTTQLLPDVVHRAVIPDVLRDSGKCTCRNRRRVTLDVGVQRWSVASSLRTVAATLHVGYDDDAQSTGGAHASGATSEWHVLRGSVEAFDGAGIEHVAYRLAASDSEATGVRQAVLDVLGWHTPQPPSPKKTTKTVKKAAATRSATDGARVGADVGASSVAQRRWWLMDLVVRVVMRSVGATAPTTSLVMCGECAARYVDGGDGGRGVRDVPRVASFSIQAATVAATCGAGDTRVLRWCGEDHVLNPHDVVLSSELMSDWSVNSPDPDTGGQTASASEPMAESDIAAVPCDSDGPTKVVHVVYHGVKHEVQVHVTPVGVDVATYSESGASSAMGAVLADVVAKLGETTADLTVSDVQVGGDTLCVPERELCVYLGV